MLLTALLIALRSLCISIALVPVAAGAPRLTTVAIQDTREFAPVVWTGRVSDASGAMREDALTETYAKDLRKKLADTRLLVDVDRKLDEAAAASLELWIRATRAGYPERKDVLVEALVLRARVLQAQNRGGSAAAELKAVFPNAPSGSAFEFAPLKMDDRYVMAAVARDDRIQQAILSIAKPREAAASQSGEDRIGSIVADALERGDVSLSTSLGERAVPALVPMIETRLDEFPPLTRDPLFHLATVNSARAADLVASSYTKGGQIWKARVLRLLNAGVFLDSGSQLPILWKPGTNDRIAPTYSVPRWFDVLELLLVDPATKREAIQLLRGIPERNAMTPGIQHALTAIMMDPASTLTPDVLAALRSGRGRPTVKELLETVLASPWPQVRAFAASNLSSFERSDALISAANSTDPEVRKSVAYALGNRYISVALYPLNSDTAHVQPKITSGDRKTLEVLAGDTDAGVRSFAAATIAQLATPLDPSVYEKLARDADSRVRAAVLAVDSLPLVQRANLALSLAGDTDPAVLNNLDQSLRRLGEVPNSEGVPDVWIPVLRARRANTADPFERNGGTAQAIYDRLSNSTTGMRLLAEWILSDDDSSAPARAFVIRLSRLRNEPKPVRLEIDGATMAKVYRVVAQRRESRVGEGQSIVRYLANVDDPPAAEFLSLAEDAALDVTARLGALAVAATAKPPRVGPLLVTLLESGDAVLPAVTGLGGEYVETIAAALDDATSKSLAAALLTNPNVNSSLAFEALNEIAAQRSLVSSESDKILTRWLDDSRSNSSTVVLAALKEVGQRPRAAQGDWLVRAAHIGSTSAWAFRYIGDTRDASYVDLLRQAIIGPFEVSGTAKPDYKGAALNALTRYFDARAADIILEAAGSTPEGAFRDECFKALETIRRYEAEKGRVARDRAAQAATATAVRDLVVMLEDSSAPIRVQALRALATLGAIEEMPAIVRCLKDKDAEVRKAAEAALDKLNAPPTEK
jgi:HEAT repeat protein